MALQIGTVDGLVNITPKAIYCFVNAIDAFSKGGIEHARKAEVALGTAFQRFVEPVYSGAKQNFNLQDIYKPVYTTNNKEQSPARVTFCKKMGLLKIDDGNDIFELTPLGREVMLKNITIEEYAFILLSKQGIFVDGKYESNLLTLVAERFENSATISDWEISDYIIEKFKEAKIEKTRTDIIVNALCTTGLVLKVNKGVCVLSNTFSAEIFRDIKENSTFISSSYLDGDDAYTEYMGAMKYGVFDIINNYNKDIYIRQYPNLVKYINLDKNNMNTGKISPKPLDEPLQQIYYGAPGTGKSHIAKKKTAGESVIRTTFHPDSDYSTFVGAYKPTTIEEDVTTVIGKEAIPVKNTDGSPKKEKKIIYEFVEQAFMQAYVNAWKLYAEVKGENPKSQYLIIEEINRGNCAQIFGDLFQLLDRGDEGYSDYYIKADKDLQKFLKKEFKDVDIHTPALCDKSDEDISKLIKEGDILLLPNNLYIWATMNTSDQSLFPIDSAFKRRWEWKYMPIANEGKGWKIEIGENVYDWWTFLDKINQKIEEATYSEDKKLGYFFCKAKNGVIDAKTFVGKVLFYLWNDVFKDTDLADSLFTNEDGKKSFDKFYIPLGEGETKVDTARVIAFMEKLEIEPKSEGEIEEEELEEEEDGGVLYVIDGDTFKRKSYAGKEIIMQYLKKHPELTFQEIKGAFPDSMLGRITYGGVIAAEGTDLGSYIRYYSPEQFTSSDGVNFRIFKQWTKVNMQNIIDFGNTHGIDVEVKER